MYWYRDPKKTDLLGNKKMKNASRIMITAVNIIGFFLIVGLHSSCRDPYDYEPQPDSLVRPPAAPTLLYPPDSFVFMTETPYVGIIMQWYAVDSAEKYLLEFGSDTILVDTPSWAGYDNVEFGPYRWRVKAGSSRWTGGYTEWSETRYFDTRPKPEPPLLIEPFNDTVINDSLPRDLLFIWKSVDDARFYEFQLFLDNDLIYHEIYSSTECTMYIEYPGRYYWHVKASDPHWQYDTAWSELWSFRVND
jgi:hypothetical protein